MTTHTATYSLANPMDIFAEMRATRLSPVSRSIPPKQYVIFVTEVVTMSCTFIVCTAIGVPIHVVIEVIMSKATWSTLVSADEAHRRAGGRRRYHAQRHAAMISRQ